jgi:cysteine-rich repeat protein
MLYRAAVALVIGTLLLGCGGGGGGGGDGGGNGGGGTNATADEMLDCQAAVQTAGAAALAARIDAVEGCGAAVMACRIRTDVDGAAEEPCATDAANACRATLDGLPDATAALAATLGGSTCAPLADADVTDGLGFDALASRCAGVTGKDAVAACLGQAIDCAAADALAASAPATPAMLAARGVVIGPAACGATAGLSIGRQFVVTGELGALFDGIVDGFPNIAAKDGVADIAGNQLGVGLKDGVTEERGIAEFPLAPLVGGLTADQITAVTLTFNVDDVLSTFGPGTDFDGTASERIQIYTYDGDGTVALDDFPRATGTPAATVTTGGQGAITDATLASTGPVVFEVDLTAQVRTLVADGATHLGVVFASDDAGSGTSLDDLGLGSSGPPGVGGARLPFITVNGGGEPEPVCGDGNPDTGEECDDGNTTAGDGCSPTCTVEPPPAACGDGTLDTAEECDGGSGNSDTAPDACRTNCRNARCGDAVIDTGEQCDPPGVACTETCTSIVIDAGAQFIDCQEALLAAGARVLDETTDAVERCLEAHVACTVASGGAVSCRDAADASCAAAASVIVASRRAFRDGFPEACVGRPPAELVVALGLDARLSACAAEGLPRTTLGDVADCVFRGVTCPVVRALGALAAGGAETLGTRDPSAELECITVP